MPVAAICEKLFRSALPLLIRLINVGRALWRYFAAKTQRDVWRVACGLWRVACDV
jgi:hypothetical protein